MPWSPSLVASCALVLLSGCAAPPKAAPAAPALPEGVLVRPAFRTAEQSFAAGTAFFVTLADGRVLGLTAHHLFGPRGGLGAELPSRALPTAVTGVRVAEPGQRRGQDVGPMLALEGAGHPTGELDASPDLAAFLAPAAFAPRALPLAEREPRAGEVVWLVAVDGARATPHRARVTAATPRLLLYTLDDASLQLEASSGSPVVDAHGAVVGVHVGLEPRDGALTGAANPVGNVRRLLAGVR